MNVQLSDDERLLKAEVRRVADEVAPLSGLLLRDSNEEKTLLDLALGLGWADPQDLTLSQRVILLQESGRALFPESLHSYLTARVVTKSLETTLGHSSVVADADAVTKLGVAYLGVDGRRTRLTLSQHDGVSSLSGAASFVRTAKECERFLVLCFDEASGQPAAAVVDATNESATPLQAAGQGELYRLVWSHQQVRSYLADPEIESAYLAGIVLAELADLAGMLRRMLEIGVDHAMNRVQFGRPIGSFQAIQHRLAEAALAADGTELWSFRIAAMIESRNIHPPYVHAGFSWARAAAITLESTAHEVTAGVGFTVEHPLHRFFWRLKSRVNSSKLAVDAWAGRPTATAFNQGAFASYVFDQPRTDLASA